MIWESVPLMTLIDVVIVGTVGYALWVFFSQRRKFLVSTTSVGFTALVLGLSSIALFYLFDLATMHLLPLFVPMAEAMAIMEELHQNYLWIVTLFAVAAIASGFSAIGRSAFAVVDKLRESEVRFRAVVDNSPTKIHIKDAEGRYLLVNPVAAALFGITDEEARGKSTHDLFPKEAADAFIAHDRAVMEGGKTVEEEEQFTCEDGEHTYLTVKFPIPDAHGGIAGVAAIGTDITPRKQAEEVLRQQGESIRLLHVVAAAANEAREPETVMQVCLDEVCAYTGWPVGHVYRRDEGGSNELATMSIWHLDNPERFATFRRVTEETRFAPGIGLPGRVLSNHEPAWIVDVTKDPNFPRAKLAEYIGVKAGFAFPILVGKDVEAVMEFFSTEALEPDEHILEIMAQVGTQLGRVLERKQAEQKLRDSESRFRGLFENSAVGIKVSTPDFDHALVNDALCRMLGYTRDELETMRLRTITHDDDIETSIAMRDRIEAGLQDSYQIERRMIRKDGKVIWVINSGTTVQEDGKYLYSISLYQDITANKEADQQLRQAQKMEAVGQLTAGVAHDFNNMLAVTWGNAELLEEEIGKDNPQLAAVFRATKRGADLTQRLLAFSRRQVLRPEIINANKLIADITGLLRHTLEEHIDIETVTAAGLWNCQVDPAQLENALVNLAINARDAMPDGGKLTIETANVRLDDDYAAAQGEVEPGQYVVLAVTDTGTGMPQDVIDHAFEPFFTTKEVGAGSGLGLSMVYGFGKQSGGHVTIYSEQNEGTTVKLYLPRSTETEVADRKSAIGKVPVGQGETVLVVEDDPEVLALAMALLGRLGYQVLGAATGAAALEQLASTTGVELLLTDVVLPGGMNGRQLATEAKRRVPEIKVLYMSGYTENAIIHHGRLDEGVELLSKPYTKQTLAQTVRRVLDS